MWQSKIGGGMLNLCCNGEATVACRLRCKVRKLNDELENEGWSAVRDLCDLRERHETQWGLSPVRAKAEFVKCGGMDDHRSE